MKLHELLSKMTEVQEKIGASVPYICGGAARDRYLQHLEKVSDLDITTGDKSIHYLSQEYYLTLKKQFNVEKKESPDGHSTIFLGSTKLDFSSNFNAPNIDNILKNMGIQHPTDMQKEMYSRDFTCNSLLLSFDLKTLIDPTNNGFKDINDKKIKTCLAPEITLTTNKNRVIRSIYLACKLDFTIDDSIVLLVKNNPEIIKISTEKSLNEKLNEAFKWNPEKASFYLTKMNLWNFINLNKNIYPYYIKSQGIK